MSFSKFMWGGDLLESNHTVPGCQLTILEKQYFTQILQICKNYGLDFYQTIVQKLNYAEMSEIAAFGGFPVRYPHWYWGMQYEELQRGYEYNQSRIFEMVVNCLVGKTKVLTTNGTKFIKNIKVGDEVISQTGTREVIFVKKQPKSPVYEIKLTNFQSNPICTKHHKWLVDGEWIETQLLRKGDRITAGSNYNFINHNPHNLTESIAENLGKTTRFSKSIPDSIWQSSNEYRAAFVKGLKRLKSKFLTLIKDLQVLLLEMGTKSEVIYDGKFWSLNIIDIDYEVEGVELVGEEVTYDIALNGKHDFLANGLVSHNTNPCVIYILSSNTLVDNLTVVAHATGHNDFFKNNIFFSQTNENMMNKLANHGSRIRKYMARWGKERVIEFIDYVLRLQTLIDPAKLWETKVIKDPIIKDSREYEFPRRLKTDHLYMDDWINPKKYIAEENKRIEENEAAKELDLFKNPEKDIFGYVKDHAPLKPWQADIMSMLYDEALYFSPQRTTKICNEGLACLLPNSSVLTNHGLIKIIDIYNQKSNHKVSDGKDLQQISNWFKFKNKEIVKIRTRRGFELGGSSTHKVLIGGKWKQLKELNIGDKVELQVGTNLWAKSDIISKNFARILGYLASSEVVCDIYLSLFNKKKEIVEDFAKLVKKYNGADYELKEKDNCWEAIILLEDLVKTYYTFVFNKDIPDGILTSTKSLIAAFLKVYIDCKGEKDVINASGETGKIIQLLLLNCGIISVRENNFIKISGKINLLNLNRFLLNEKIDLSDEFIDDEIVEISKEVGEVYDITVENTHCYVAQGFINHNSFIDYEIMTRQGYVSLGQKSHDCGIIDYAKHKMAVLGGKYSMNPYKIGFYLLLDIEERWNKGQFGQEWEDCKDVRKKEAWDLNLGLGKQKIFEVRKYYNDFMFINEFFTQEFCDKFEFFEWKHYPNGEYRIESRDAKQIKKKLLGKYLHGGLPDIRLADPNYRGKGLLLLEHYWNGKILYDEYAKAVLSALYFLWGKGIVLSTKDKDEKDFVYFCEGSDPDKDVILVSKEEFENAD